MATPDPSELIRVLCGQQVFGRDIDSKILQAANGMSARLMFELFTRCDLNREDWASDFANELMEIGTGDPLVLVGLDDGRWQGIESTGEEVPDDTTTACEFFLRLEFTNEDASYYQFHLFPSFNEPFIQSVSRKREGPCQHLSLTLAHPDDLQVFIQHLRTNPHLKAVHDSNEAAFNAAPSHSI